MNDEIPKTKTAAGVKSFVHGFRLKRFQTKICIRSRTKLARLRVFDKKMERGGKTVLDSSKNVIRNHP